MRTRKASALAGLTAATIVATALAANPSIELVSVNGKGKPLDRRSGLASISADGRSVTFTIDLGFAPGDITSESDVWVYDSRSQRAERVSGAPRDRSSSFDSSISGNGRYIAFVSNSDRLVSADTDSGGSISVRRPDIFVYDRKRERTELISQDKGKGGRDSLSPVISADGRFVAFASNSNNLVGGDAGPSKDFQVYIYDRKRKLTKQVSLTPDGKNPEESSWEPAISADGSRVAYYSSAEDIVPGTGEKREDVFVHDLETKMTQLVSVAPDGSAGNDRSVAPAISADGSRVAFSSIAGNLVAVDPNGGRGDVFVRDLETEETMLVSLGPAGVGGDGASFAPDISADGSHVAYASEASNLVAGDDNGEPDVFLTELATAATRLVSDAGDGSGNDFSDSPAVSEDGRFVAFASAADDLAADDGKRADVFLRDLGTSP